MSTLFTVKFDDDIFGEVELENGETIELEMDGIAIAQVEYNAGNAVVTVVEQGGVVKANVVTLAEA